MTQSMPGNAEVSRFEEAYNQLRDEIRAVAPSDYVMINIDVPTAITTVLGVLPAIRALRPRVAAELAQFDTGRFDKLEAYTLALGHAHAGYMSASQPAQSLDMLSEEGARLRDLLLSDASALAERRLIDGARLRQLKGVRGYRNLAFDLLTLARLFRDVWGSVQGKCAVQMREIQRAEALADQILQAVGHREQAPTTVVEAAETRQKAFALFMGAYEHVQRAVRFLRWDTEDWDDITPSIFNRASTRRKASADDEKPDLPVPAAQAPVPNVPVNAKPTNGTQVANSPGIGLPNSDPFLRG
jgi:hypothetical protein